jgi:hypothetical protein
MGSSTSTLTTCAQQNFRYTLGGGIQRRKNNKVGRQKEKGDII